MAYQVLHGSTTCGQRRGSKKALEKSEDKETSEIIHQGGRYTKYDENTECNKIGDISSDDRDLT